MRLRAPAAGFLEARSRRCMLPDAAQMPRRCQLHAAQMPLRCRSDAAQAGSGRGSGAAQMPLRPAQVPLRCPAQAAGSAPDSAQKVRLQMRINWVTFASCCFAGAGAGADDCIVLIQSVGTWMPQQQVPQRTTPCPAAAGRRAATRGSTAAARAACTQPTAGHQATPEYRRPRKTCCGRVVHVAQTWACPPIPLQVDPRAPAAPFR